MRKRIVSSLLLGCALLTGGVSTAYTVHAEICRHRQARLQSYWLITVIGKTAQDFNFCWMKTMIHMVM